MLVGHTRRGMFGYSSILELRTSIQRERERERERGRERGKEDIWVLVKRWHLDRPHTDAHTHTHTHTQGKGSCVYSSYTEREERMCILINNGTKTIHTHTHTYVTHTEGERRAEAAADCPRRSTSRRAT